MIRNGIDGPDMVEQGQLAEWHAGMSRKHADHRDSKHSEKHSFMAGYHNRIYQDMMTKYHHVKGTQ